MKTTLLYILPMFVLISLINPLFNHAGVTILTYLPDGNPLTLESIIFGAVSALMLSAILLWCSSMTVVMTSDRVIYIFGRMTPKLGLLISMILRLIPKFSSQFRSIRAARHCIGKDITDGSLFRRLSNVTAIFSAMIQWSMENAMETADSLKSRGYGLPHRKFYSLFHFEKRDAVLLSLFLVCDAAILAVYFSGTLLFEYYPMTSTADFGAASCTAYLFYLILCTLPLVLDKREDRKWKHLRSAV